MNTNINTNINNDNLMFNIPKLNFDLSSFSPYLSQKTMNIHYNVLHNNYVSKSNLLLTTDPYISNIMNTEKNNVFNALHKLFNNKHIKPTYKQLLFKNAILGHINHNFFWKMLSSEPQTLSPSSQLYQKISEDFGTTEHFKNRLTQIFSSHFSNGWGWVVLHTKTQKLKIITTNFHNNPIFLSWNLYPILCIDLWEHAYILDYGLKGLRKQYILDLYNFINWKVINNLFLDIKKIINSTNHIKLYFNNWLNL